MDQNQYESDFIFLCEQFFSPFTLGDPNLNENVKIRKNVEDLDGIRALRKILSHDGGDTSIQIFLENNLLLFKLNEFIEPKQSDSPQRDASWVLTNNTLAPFQQREKIIHIGGIEKFGKLLNSKHPEIAEIV